VTQIEDVDVLIVGAGVVGTAIAAELSLYDLRVAVAERRHDVGDETSKANSGIAATGSFLKPGTLEADLVVRSNPRWEDITLRLGIHFRRVGLTLLAFSDEEVAQLDGLAEICQMKGIRASVVLGDEVRNVAPHASPNALGGVHVPDEGVIDSVRVPVAYAELAELNGVTFYLGEPVIGSVVMHGAIASVATPKREFRTRFVVNSAGLGADLVSSTLHAESFDVIPRRGQWFVLDREFGKRVPSVLTGFPTNTSHGAMILPTAHGSVLLGPTAEDIDDKQDLATDEPTLTRVLADCMKLMPSVDPSFVMKTFSGVRSHSEPTYRVGVSEGVRNVVQVAGIRSTGMSASPCIAEHVRDLLGEAGLPLTKKSEAVDRVGGPPPLWTTFDWQDAATRQLDRTVICACEKVTAGDIHRALQPPMPARSVNGVARRTHATWGRCQGSACLSGVCFLTSLYTGGAAWEVSFGDPGSTLGVGAVDDD
jgi:glycerol-3-phosphate dehydrogenase